MPAWLFRFGMIATLGLVEAGQVHAIDAARGVGASSDREREGRETQVVVADQVEVHVHPDEASFGMATLARGDRVRIRQRKDGWAEIDPPQGVIGWVERTSLAMDEREKAGADGGTEAGMPERARIVGRGVMARAGHLGARMPGPAWVEVPGGTWVRLVDVPPLRTGRGPSAREWLAIVPPVGARCHVRAEALASPPQRQAAAEMLAAYLVPIDDPERRARGVDGLPPEVRAAIDRLDRMHRSILVDQPVARWNLQPVRSGYQDLLSRWGDQPAVEEALRIRLARVTRHEQATVAAREFQEVLARSRHRDAQVASIEKRLAELDLNRTLRYAAVGLVQPSARMVNGHRLHVLVGRQGQTIAYLDMPPGLDVEALGTKRVGVRGTIHYSQELGTRLITVRDVDTVGARR